MEDAYAGKVSGKQTVPSASPTRRLSSTVQGVVSGVVKGDASSACDMAAALYRETVESLAGIVPNKKVRAERFMGLNGARILASIHIVLGHAYQLPWLESGANSYIYRFGFTWVPWFFMLSGFVLCHARQHARDPTKVEKLLPTLRKRTAFIYPLYAVALLLSLFVDFWRGRTLPAWWCVLLQAFLAQSWTPFVPENVLQVHCWFLSAMVPYWLFFDVVFRRGVLKIERITTCAAVSLLLLLPPFLYFVPAAAIDPDWYREHTWASTDTAVDIGVVLLKFHPACYAHVFLFGMCLARLRKLVVEALDGAKESKRTKSKREWRVRALERLMRFGSSLGYFWLLLVFTVEPLRPASWKLSARLSVLQAAQGLVILGLAPIPSKLVTCSGKAIDQLVDPITFVLSFSPPQWGHISYGQYVLQFICIALWPADMLSRPSELFLFFMFLLGWAHFASNLLTIPAARWWNKRSPVQLFFACATVGLVGSIMCGSDVYERTRADEARAAHCEPYDGTYVHLLPEPYVRVPVAYGGGSGQVVEDAIDVRLNWTAASTKCNATATTSATNTATEACDDATVLINPSLVWARGADGETLYMRAARTHRVECAAGAASYFGDEIDEVNVTWHSEMVMDDGQAARSSDGSAALLGAWATWDVQGWRLDGPAPLQPVVLATAEDGEAWAPLCQVASTLEEATNVTTGVLTRLVVTGAEDPKFINLDTGDRGQVPSLAFTSLPPDRPNSTSCGYVGITRTEDGNVYTYNEPQDAVKQQYQTYGALEPNGSAAYHAAGAHVRCGFPDADEKNWIHFNRGGKIYYVYTVYPHLVVEAKADGSPTLPSGACRQSLTSDASNGGNADAYRRLEEMGQAGGGFAIHGSAAAVEWDGGYLAVFHLKKTSGNNSGAYVTMAYTFASTPPFAITNVSRPIPLAGGNASFASALAIAPGGSKVVVGYGMADMESRAFVMSTEYLRSLFDWSVACTLPPPPPAPPPPPQPEMAFLLPIVNPGSACVFQGTWRDCSRSERSVVVAYITGLVALCLCCCVCCVPLKHAWQRIEEGIKQQEAEEAAMLADVAAQHGGQSSSSQDEHVHMHEWAEEAKKAGFLQGTVDSPARSVNRQQAPSGVSNTASTPGGDQVGELGLPTKPKARPTSSWASPPTSAGNMPRSPRSPRSLLNRAPSSGHLPSALEAFEDTLVSSISMRRIVSGLHHTTTGLKHGLAAGVHSVEGSLTARSGTSSNSSVDINGLPRPRSWSDQMSNFKSVRSAYSFAKQHSFFQHDNDSDDDGTDQSGLVMSSVPIRSEGWKTMRESHAKGALSPERMSRSKSAPLSPSKSTARLRGFGLVSPSANPRIDEHRDASTAPSPGASVPESSTPKRRGSL